MRRMLFPLALVALGLALLTWGPGPAFAAGEKIVLTVASVPAGSWGFGEQVWSVSQSHPQDARPAPGEDLDPATSALEATCCPAEVIDLNAGESAGRARVCVHCTTTSTITAGVPGGGIGTTSPGTGTPSTVMDTILPGPSRRTLIS